MSLQPSAFGLQPSSFRRTALTIPLGDLSKADIPLAGGKAVNLGELIAREFPVPGGFVITTGAYRQFLECHNIFGRIEEASKSTGEDPQLASDSVSRLMMEMPVPAAVADEIGQALHRLGEDKPVAVRSSATAEDLEHASFAGLHDTCLNVVGIDGVLESVKLCWASLWSERAMAYRRRAGVGDMQAEMAVVVQVMARADVSGVMFTANPVTAHPGEIVVDAVRGPCEDLVSGRAQPDHFVLRKSTGEIKRSRPSVKNRSGGMETTEETCMLEGDLKALAILGRRVEREMGCPQDIEWAIENGGIALLQSRPITTLPPEGETVFTRKMGDQYWTDVIAPLTFTCGVDWIVEGAFKPLFRMVGDKGLAELDLFRLHKSHLYMNTRLARESITMFPMSARKQFIDSMGSPHDDDYFLEAPYRPIRGIVAMIIGHLSDKRSGMNRNLRALEEWSRVVKDTTGKMLRRIDEGPPIEELMQMFDEVNRMGVEHFEIIRWGHASYSTALTDTFRAMCDKWADDADCSLFLTITGHLDPNMTMETDQALWETAREIANDPAAKRILSTLEPDEAARRILDGDDFPAARIAFSRFLEDYGHRTTSRDITVPHWREAPGQVAGVIKGIIAGELPPSPRSKSEAARVRMEKAMAEALGRIRRKWYGFLVKWWFKHTAEKTRVFIGYRENQRFTLDRIMALMRRLALAIGQWLVEQGRLERADDIFFVRRDELTQAVCHGQTCLSVRGKSLEKKQARTSYRLSMTPRIDPDVRRQIPDRRREFESNSGRLPATYIMGDFEFEDQYEFTVGAHGHAPLPPGEYAGLNVSPGVVEGSARVLTDLAQAHLLQEGEILVIECTDPAWSAAFMKVAGLVLETGGLLSHGAILAREFGLPAVTHISGATRLIRTGDRLRIDGTRGRVTILAKT